MVLNVTERQPILLVPYRTSFLEVAEDGWYWLCVPLCRTSFAVGDRVSVKDEVRLGQQLPGEEVAQVSRCLNGLPADFWSGGRNPPGRKQRDHLIYCG